MSKIEAKAPVPTSRDTVRTAGDRTRPPGDRPRFAAPPGSMRHPGGPRPPGAAGAPGDRTRDPRVPRDRIDNRVPGKEKDRLNGATILMRRVSKTRARGRISAMSATVVAGDGMGRVAVATASSKEAQESLRKARMQAESRMQAYQIWNKRTLPYDITGRYGVVKIIARRARAGTGIIASDTMRAIFEAAGIKDVVAKVIKGRNPLNVAQATINALETIPRPKKDLKEERDPKDTKDSARYQPPS